MKTFIASTKTHVAILGSLIAVMWAAECIDFFMLGSLDRFGIVPRDNQGLRGILFMPFLHGDFKHLIANTVPFAVLGWIVLWRGAASFFFVMAAAMVLGGLGVWAFGAPNSVHIGASGVIFGFLGFLLACGWFERRLFSIVLSVAVGAVYGGMLWGVLPGQVGISWEGHLFGFVAGVVAAKLVTARGAYR